MCGIAGIFGPGRLDLHEHAVGRMNDAMAHRGPDAQGIWRGPDIVLGHRRLSIIDPNEGSHQPFHDGDGRYTIVFNGEIYNYRELRRELEATSGLGHGRGFRTASDTEVLLRAYEAWGASCLDRLEGMFAFAIWDRDRNELFLARDRMGIKPLYLYRSGGTCIFASELRALLASGMVPRRLDADAVVDFLRYQTVHGPNTMIKDIRMLRPGYWMKFTAGEVVEHRWYDPTQAAIRQRSMRSLEEVRGEVRQRLARAVEKRMVADVPFGAFLSGGIDSSAIVGLMAEVSSAPVHTFSIGFDEERFSEERFAGLVARKFRTEHTPIRLGPMDMLRELPHALAAMDHPSADGPNTYVVSKVTKQAGISMALSGLGGDEVFAGYPVFTRTLSLRRHQWITRTPPALRMWLARAINAARPGTTSVKLGELLRAGSFSVEETYPISRLVRSDAEIMALIRTSHLPANAVTVEMEQRISRDRGSELPLLSQVSLGELGTYLPDVLLRDTDQMSMAHALEVRVPFLDHDLVEFVLSVEDDLKFPHTPKELLVRSLGDLLPPEIVHRPKMGFVLPWELWMRAELRDLCEERLTYLGGMSMFRSDAVARLWERFLAADRRVSWSRLWSLVVLADWLQRNAIEE